MSGRRGLSLVEVVVAIVVLGLAVPPVIVQISVAARAQAVAVVEQNLNQLATERIGEVFADQVNKSRGFNYIQTAAYPTESAPRSMTGYTRQTEVREVSSTDFVTPAPGSGIKRFRVIVTGPDGERITVESFVVDLLGAGAGGGGPSPRRKRTVDSASKGGRR